MTFYYYFYRVSILLITICSFVFSQIVYPSDSNANELPFCGQDNFQERKLILVSTLDGKVSALNLDNGGTESWNIGTGPGPMLSSSIHRLELTNNGQWVRMIPSLSGGLYKFNGENIEAIPITAENLLRSSFRYSDDLVISGGKESRTYGVEVETGRVLYECSLGGCDNLTEAEVTGDVILVQRLTQTVRAVEPRTGVERWNFSVGLHELKMLPGLLVGCHNTEPISDNILLKVIVPEGLVCAVSKTQPGLVLWSHKFDSPVVSAWKVGRGRMEVVDLFGGDLPLARPTHDDLPFPSSPALYVGMHHKQLYIQESVTMQHKLHQLAEASFRYHLLTDEKKYPQIPWNPVHVTSTALDTQDHDSKLSHEESNQTTAISVLYASEYVNGKGYYLYNTEEESVSLCSSDSAKEATVESNVNVTVNNSSEPEELVDYVEPPDDNTVFTPNQIFVVTSLWFWWKEVFLISVTTAVVVNLVIQRRVFQGMSLSTTQIIFVKDTLKSYSSRDSGRDSNSTLSTSSLPVSVRSADSFESRFLTDFMPVNCLGKGGFGVVFEAKNKIDDCHYAIKRIQLPNSEESREKVMREVKALAKLDHHNIVRYFNAWLECPPPGWQETQDKKWKSSREVASSNGDAFTVDLTGQVTPDSERSFGNVINRNRLKPLSLLASTNWKSELSEIPTKPEPPDDDNDSYIVFGSPSRDVSEAESENNNCCKAVEDSADKLDSAITIASDTSRDTNTDVTDVDKSNSPKRPKSLSIKSSGDLAPGCVLNSSRMFLFIQMQLCKKKSLKDWLKDNVHNRPRLNVINMFDQIVQAVEYVHMQGLIHRDLKPSNIFFSPDGQVKVGDFGLVTAMAESPTDMWVSVEAELDTWGEVTDDRHTARVGTQLYMSPEQVAGKPYSYKVDIYSLGVILFELLVPFNTQMERIHTLTNLKANKYPDDFQTQFSQEYELLKMMLSHRPDDRPTTFGIRARPPLNCDSPLNVSTSDWHFDLPNRRRLSTSASRSSNNSTSLD